MKRRLRVAFAIVGIGVLALLIARIGPSDVASHVARARLGLAWLVIAYATGTAIAAVPWYWLLERCARPRVRGAVASRFAASGANAALPAFAVGGEPVRLLWLKPPDRAAGTAAIVVDRILYAVASALFLLAGLAVVADVTAIPDAYVIAATVCAATAIVVATGAAVVAGRGRAAGAIHRAIEKLRRRDDGDRDVRFGRNVDRKLEAMLTGAPGKLLALLAVHVLARVALGAEIYAAFRVIGVDLSIESGLILASVPIALGLIASWVPSQIGLQEGAIAVVASALGIDPAAGVAAVVLQRIRQLASVAFAWMLVVRVRPAETSDHPR